MKHIESVLRVAPDCKDVINYILKWQKVLGTPAVLPKLVNSKIEKLCWELDMAALCLEECENTD